MFFKYLISAFFLFFLFFPNTSFAQNSGCCFYDTLGFCENVGKEQESRYGQDAQTLCKGSYYPDRVCSEDKVKCVCPPDKLCLQVPFPGSDIVEKADAKTIFPEYIRVMYRFAIWIAITLGIFMMMMAGFQWLTAGGSPDRVGKAKGYISNAIIGIIIALFSFIILQTINPRLVELTLPEIKGPDIQSGQSCCYNKAADQMILTVLLDPKKGDTCESVLAGLYGSGWLACESVNVPSCLCVVYDIGKEEEFNPNTARRVGTVCNDGKPFIGSGDAHTGCRDTLILTFGQNNKWEACTKYDKPCEVLRHFRISPDGK